MKKHYPADYKFFPKTWLLPTELAELKLYANKQDNQKKYYIVKPEALSQGKGIFITKKIDQIDLNEHLVV